MARRLFALAVLCGALLAQATAAQGAFAPANEAIVSAEQLSTPGLAIDAGGNSTIVWSQETPPSEVDEVKARRLDAGGGLGPVVDLAPGEIGSFPAVAVSTSGRAFAAWESGVGPESNGVRGRWIEPDGSLGPLLTLIDGGAEVDAGDVHVAIDPAGVATVAWKNQQGNELELRRVQPDNALGLLVPNASKGSVTNPEIAALPGGETVAVWRNGGVEMNIISSTLLVGEPSKISETSSAGDPQIAVDSLGNGLVVWRTFESLPDPDEFSVRGRRVGPAGGLGTELTIDPPGTGEVGGQVGVSADTESDFVVTWTREDAEEDAIVYVRRGNSLGVPAGPAQPLSADGASARLPQAAIEDGGEGAAVWANDLGSGNATTSGRTFDSLTVPTGGIQELLNDGEQGEVASAPAVGAAAFLILYPISGSAQSAVVRRFLLPPTCSDSSATVVQGQPIEAPLACSGAAIEGAEVVAPPQHGQTGAFDGGGPALAYTPTPGFEGTDSFTYRALNDGGGSNVARVDIAVGRDTVRPRITSLRFVRSVRKPRAGSSARKRKPRKPAFKFVLKLSEPAGARVTVERAGPGVRKGKRCAKPRGGARGKRCTRWRRIGAVASSTGLTSVTLPVRGKLYKRLLSGGRFRGRGVATDPAANRSSQRTVGFKVKRRPRR